MSVQATGNIDTVGNNTVIDDWHITVTTRERLAHYSRSKTASSALNVSSDGRRMTVAASIDGISDGGSLMFRSRNPFVDFGAVVADFTSNFSNQGGQAAYLAGAAFDFLSLNQPDGTLYTAALASPASGDRFYLLPLAFPNGVALSGSIRTDGTIGALDAANFLSWEICVDQVTEDVYDPSNSVASAGLLGISANGLDLTVDNPDGSLTFARLAGGARLFGVQLADFTNQWPAGGQAAYYQGRFAVTTVPLNAREGAYPITGQLPVPEPGSLLLAAVALGSLGLRSGRRSPPLAPG